MAMLERDNFGNPIYGQKILIGDKEIPFRDMVFSIFSGGAGVDTVTARSFCDAIYDRWHNYGIQFNEPFSEDSDTAVGQMQRWAGTELVPTFKALWRRYKDIVEAYKTKVDWASGITNTTTYKDVKDTSTNNGESTDWALPNKKVEAPYGTPTGHSENKGGNTNTKTGSVETKGMLNPVTQRDLYARLIRDTFGEMAEECAPLFNQMHL